MNQKRRKRKLPLDNNINENQSYTDFLCPICLQILIEPVQMPCKHELCMQCFKLHVETTSLQCPMCRLRISVWLRRNNKNLINTQRWELIKSLFPERVQRRMDGDDDFENSYEEYNAPKRSISTKGEVRKEYEEELKKIEEERAAITEANLEYIRKLEVEEEECRRKQEELDQAAAHALQKEEMDNLGVTLKSPSAHQRELLAYLKPKSPMKLRHRKRESTSNNAPQRKSLLTSPNHTITDFFQRQETSNPKSTKIASSSVKILCNNEHQPKEPEEKLTHSTPSCSKTAEEHDFEFARQLQEDFDKELQCKSSKQPLKVKNSISPFFSPNVKLRKSTNKFLFKTTQENR